MKLVTKGDSSAFEEVYDRYASKMMNYFHRLLWKDRLKAEDFTHELFTKIIQKPESFDPSRSFKTWLFSIANNMCKNEYKKAEVRKNADDIIKHDIDVQSDGSYILNALDREKFNADLDRELSKLDENHRLTFELRYRQEFSIKEISEMLNCSEGTVKSRIFYTLKKIGKKLKQYDPNKLEKQESNIRLN